MQFINQSCKTKTENRVPQDHSGPPKLENQDHSSPPRGGAGARVGVGMLWSGGDSLTSKFKCSMLKLPNFKCSNVHLSKCPKLQSFKVSQLQSRLQRFKFPHFQSFKVSKKVQFHDLYGYRSHIQDAHLQDCSVSVFSNMFKTMRFRVFISQKDVSKLCRDRFLHY